MRRNAMCLLAPILVIGVGIGCKQADKTNSDAQTAEAFTEPYTPSMYSVPVQEYRPYAADPAPSPTERFSPTMMASAAAETMSATYHTVAKKDTLYALARMYYNDAARWKDIYEANRGEIPDPNKIFIGQRLLIP